MNRRARLIVLAVSVPIIVFAVVGGFMGRALAAREDTYQVLRIFEDVVTQIIDNYVEEVDTAKVMTGAMHGLVDGLDPDSAYLTGAQVRVFENGDEGGAGQTGLELTRQYYLRVIAARDGSPAARAGLMTGDYIRAIDGQSTRDTTVFAGMHLLRGKPGTTVSLTVLRGNAAEPHIVELTREALAPAVARGRQAASGAGYVRISEFLVTTPAQLKTEIATLTKGGSTTLIIDVRGTAFGDVDAGVVAARLFVPSGTLAYRQDRGKDKEAITAGSGDGAITMPVAVLTDNGTSGAAELFASALSGNKRATLVGERTLGRAARQKLVKLPDGSGLLLTHLMFLTPAGIVIHEKGLTPDVAVEQQDVEFGQPPATTDAILDRAILALTDKKAA